MEEKIILALLSLFIVCIFSVIGSIDRRINKIQIQLVEISKKVGITEEQVNEKIDKELIGLIAQGKIAKAIKKYKRMTGEGFKEANEYIDNITSKEK